MLKKNNTLVDLALNVNDVGDKGGDALGSAAVGGYGRWRVMAQSIKPSDHWNANEMEAAQKCELQEKNTIEMIQIYYFFSNPKHLRSCFDFLFFSKAPPFWRPKNRCQVRRPWGKRLATTNVFNDWISATTASMAQARE